MNKAKNALAIAASLPGLVLLQAPRLQADDTNPQMNYCTNVCGSLASLSQEAQASGFKNSIPGQGTAPNVGNNADTAGVGSTSSLAWCTAHGAGPGSAVFTGANGGVAIGSSTLTTPLGVASTTPSLGTSNCNINGLPMNNIPGDPIDINSPGGCAQMGLLIQACSWLSNSQLVNYCQAFEAIVGQGGSVTGSTSTVTADAFLAAADTGVAAVCLAECVSPTPPVNFTCTISAMATGIAEAATALSMDEGQIGQYISSIGGGLGVVGGATAVLATRDIVGDKAKDLTSNKVMSCSLAGLFAIMAGVRVVDIKSQQTTAASVCSNINSLASSSNSTGGGAGGPTGSSSSSGGGGFSPGSPGAGGGYGALANTSANGLTGTSTTTTAASGPYGAPPPVAAAATAGGGLDGNTFKDNPNLVPNADLSGLMGRAMAGDTRGMMSDALPSGVGAGLGDLATLAAQDPQKFAALGLGFGNERGGVFAAAGAGGGAKSADAPANPFAGMLGGGVPKDTGARGPAGTDFGKQSIAMDIWHTGSRQTIFQIVSSKVLGVTPRVNARTVHDGDYDLRE